MKLNLKHIACILLLAISIASCSSNKPDAVAVKFLTATNDENYAEAKKYCDEATVELLDMASSFAGMNEKEKEASEVIIVATDVKDDTAEVTYKTAPDAEEKMLKLKKIDGDWKVSLAKED